MQILSFPRSLLSAVFALMMSIGCAASDIPSGVSDLLKTAASNQDQANFNSILQTAFVTWPEQRVDLLELAESIKSDWLGEKNANALKEAREEEIKAEQRSRARGLFHYIDPDLWHGQAEMGAGHTSGDSSEQSFTGGLKFKRSFGEEWDHEVDMNLDYARSSGETTQELFVTEYRVKWKPWDNLFLINFLELEINRPSGYSYRVVENLGLGYQLLETEKHKLSVEAGPGFRFSKEINDPLRELYGMTDAEFLGRLSLRYELQINENMKFEDRAGLIVGQDSTTLENKLELSARINSHLAARVSFEIKYDSVAPIGTARTDTISRATIVYDF